MPSRPRLLRCYLLHDRLVHRALAMSCLLCVGTGCRSAIGDACATNVECSPNGDRICDTSQLDGYCTVQGCSANSCPEDSICVAFYPTGFGEKPCNAATEDSVQPGITPTNDCLRDERCLSSGTCVLLTTESRFCVKTCEESANCRTGYACQTTGEQGAEAGF